MCRWSGRACSTFTACSPRPLPGPLSLYLRIPAAGQTPLPALRETNWAALAGAVWLLGALVCFIVRAVPRLRLRRFLKRRRRMAGPRVRRVARRLWRELNGLDDLDRDRTFEPHLSDKDICVVDGLPGPMCVTSRLAGGPCLLLDREDYDDETLDAILRHELSHLTQNGLYLWGNEDVLAALGWWNPGAWLLRRHLRAENEFCCDDWANRDRSRAGRAAYARALAALAARKRAFLPGTAQMACEKGLLRRRVQAVMEPPSPRRSFFAGALLLLLVFACLLFCQPPERDTALLTEQNFFSYLAASGDDRPEAFNFGAAGAVYGARGRGRGMAGRIESDLRRRSRPRLRPRPTRNRPHRPPRRAAEPDRAGDRLADGGRGRQPDRRHPVPTRRRDIDPPIAPPARRVHTIAADGRGRRRGRETPPGSRPPRGAGRPSARKKYRTGGHAVSNFLAVSLGACLSLGMLLLFYRKCERWLDSGAWSWIFGFSVWELLLYVAFHVFPDLLFGHGDPSYGLIHVGFPVNPRPCLRELAAGWRPGPLEIFGWIWLIGFVLCLLGQVASLLRFWRRVDKESRPASERVQRALMDVSRALEDGVLSEKAYEDGAREVVVMPSLSGPVSLVLGVRLLLLDREDYDDETLDAILRHELVHVYGRNTSMRRLSWFALGGFSGSCRRCGCCAARRACARNTPATARPTLAARWMSAALTPPPWLPWPRPGGARRSARRTWPAARRRCAAAWRRSFARSRRCAGGKRRCAAFWRSPCPPACCSFR